MRRCAGMFCPSFVADGRNMVMCSEPPSTSKRHLLRMSLGLHGARTVPIRKRDGPSWVGQAGLQRLVQLSNSASWR